MANGIFPVDGAEYAGDSVTIMNMKAEGDIIHDDWMRKMVVSLENAELTGKVFGVNREELTYVDDFLYRIGTGNDIKVYDLFVNGKTQEAMSVFAQSYSLIKANYAEVNPTCAKYLLSLMGLASDEVRLPLGSISEENKIFLKQIYEQTPKDIFL